MERTTILILGEEGKNKELTAKGYKENITINSFALTVFRVLRTSFYFIL